MWIFIAIIIASLGLAIIIYRNSDTSNTSNTHANPTLEQFGFNIDNSVDLNLVNSGLNTLNPEIRTGNGIRDMFDFSNRFITAQFQASNDIDAPPRISQECK